MEGAKFNPVHGSERKDRKSHHQLKYKSSFLCSNPFPGQNSSIDMYGSAVKTAVSDCKRSRMSSKLAIEMMGSDSFTNHSVAYGGKVSGEQEKPRLHDKDNHTYKAPKNKKLSRTSGCSETLGTERGPSSGMAKVVLVAYISVHMLFHSAVSA